MAYYWSFVLYDVNLYKALYELLQYQLIYKIIHLEVIVSKLTHSQKKLAFVFIATVFLYYSHYTPLNDFIFFFLSP